MLSNSMKSPIEISSLLTNYFSFTIIPHTYSSSQLVILGPLLSHIDFRTDLSRTIKNNCAGIVIGLELNTRVRGWGGLSLPHSQYVSFWSLFCFAAHILSLSHKDVLLGVSKTTLKLGDLLERSNAKGRGTWGRVQRKAGMSFQESSPQGPTQDTPDSFSHRLWLRVPSHVYQGSTLETWCTRLLSGAGHIGTRCLSRTQIPDSQKSNTCSAKTTLFAQCRWGGPLLFGKVLYQCRELAKFWDAAQGPTL